MRIPLKICRTSLTAIALALTLVMAGSALAGEIRFPTSGGYFNVPVTTLKEARFRSIVNQQYDYSCGSAALATLLTYHYDQPMTETEIFQTMFEAGDKEQITTRGFSLLDMKSYLESQNYQAEGYRVGLDKIAEVGVPAIVVINTNGYKHFVVLKGITDNEVLIGDPALGVKVMSRTEFEAIREGDILFVIISHADLGTEYFNQEDDWKVRAHAPFGSALSRQSLSTFTLLLPGRNEF